MKRNRAPKFTKVLVELALSGIMLLAVAGGLKNFLSRSSLFTVKTVIATGALKKRLAPDEFKLKGKNLFVVDIHRLARQIKLDYPYLYHIQASRVLPDKIWLDAKERFPVARVKLAGRVFLCDIEAVIMPLSDGFASLPLFTGLDIAAQAVRVGEVYDSSRLKLALEILKQRNSSPQLSALIIERIEVATPEKASVFLNTGTEVIVGNEGLDNRFKVLGLVLKNLDTGLAKIKYIDLRFNEPAIGKR